jgi:predicted Holliday junction resolvase-like endonuclease
MRKGWVIIMVFLVFSACNNEASVKVNVDSVGKKFDTAAGKLWDSTKQGLKRAGEKLEEKARGLKEKLKDKLDDKKDSVRKKDK